MIDPTRDPRLLAPYRVPVVGLVFAFLLELAMFAALGVWGWHLGDGGAVGALLAALFVIVAVLVWALCRAPGDLPHGRSRLPVPGSVRIAIEWAILALAVYGIWTAWSRAAGETLLTAGVIHYALTWERLRWLLSVRHR